MKKHSHLSLHAETLRSLRTARLDVAHGHLEETVLTPLCLLGLGKAR